MASLKKLVLENQVCPIPWVHAEVHGHNGLVYPCCKYKQKVGTIGDSFSSVWQNTEYQKIRWDLSTGISHDNCSACDVPDHVFSYKKWKSETYLKNSILDDIDTDNECYPKVLHIGGFSNLCNLACRMCNPQSSSTLDTLSRKTELKKYYPIQNASNNLSVDSFDEFVDNLTHITVSGGEPFLDKKLFEFVKKLKGSKKLQQINFSTNLTKLNIELFEFLSTLDADVNISVSLDGNKQIHEYIRYGCDYDSIIDNIKIIRSRYPRFQFGINTTLSVYNVGYAIETLESFLEISRIIKIKDLMISPVLKPEKLHPGVLSEEIKELYLEKYSANSLTKFSSVPNSQTLIETARQMMSQDYTEKYREFIDFTKTFDSISKTNYLEIYPELANH